MDALDIVKYQIQEIKKNTNVTSIILVGSMRNLEFDVELSDIDIFVITEEGNRQIRKILEVSGVEFDVNYFSRKISKELIKKREQFFIECLKDGNLVYDKDGFGDYIIKESIKEYNKGPKRIEDYEINNCIIKINDYFKKLKKLQNGPKYEFHFLSNLCLKEMIKLYYKLNNMWIPKDKKLLKSLRDFNNDLFSIAVDFYNEYDIKKLKKVFDYIMEKNIQKEM
ncbi:nucleotidyltransferase domain-containing protein [Caloranaerobacter ferrireducens]|uniref:nucleotidyltransferase domain-containing protein n=1 Tax=Caloranaerobacter ferrireducens TaxID=1323370 RepID=UPI00084D5F63|nr:nucleotidyltransferase domain-containing protein [Caloranaerobacter ferrireducens]